MEKKLKIKLFDKNKEYKFDIINNYIENDIIFSNVLNNGQSACRIVVGNGLNFDNFRKNDYIEIYEYISKTKLYNLIYSGNLKKTGYILNEGKEVLELIFAGIGALLVNDVFSNSTKDDIKEPADYVRDIVDSINLTYNYFQFGNIVNFGEGVNIELKGKTYLEALKLLSDITGYNYYINPDGKIDFAPYGDTEVMFIVGQDLVGLEYKTDIIESYNTLILEYNEGNNQELFEDIPKQTEIGTIQKYVKKPEIIDQDTATTFGENFLKQHKDDSEILTLFINSQNLYNVNELIGKKIRIIGIKKEIKENFINRIDYTTKGMKIYGNGYNDINLEIKKLKNN